VVDSIRRLVTGHGVEGTSVVLSDGAVPHIRRIEESGVTFFEVWTTRAMPAPVTADEDEPTDRPIAVPPPANGTIVRFCQFDPPASQDASAPFMHRTETVDYGIVVSGEITLLLDDGSESVLTEGDVVIQRGTDHGLSKPFHRAGAGGLRADRRHVHRRAQGGIAPGSARARHGASGQMSLESELGASG
jgi:hypothetical protein